MRLRNPFSALLLAATLTVAGGASVRAQTTTPPPGDKAAYFLLDFNDGTATPAFGFQFNYPTSQSATATTLIQALAAAPLAPKLNETHIDYGGSLGYYYTAFAYGAHSAALTGDYGYGWTFYTSTNGVSWTAPSLGASSTSISSGTPWVSFSYGPTGFTASGNPIAPPSASTLSSFATVTGSLAAPEPSACVLLSAAAFGYGGIGLIRRRYTKNGAA